MIRISAFFFLIFLSFQVFAVQKMMMDHSHMPINVPDNAPTPRLSLELTRDVMSGFNLHLHIRNYQFSVPPAGMTMSQMMNVGPYSAEGFLQGHAHLYVNGDKIQRVYGQNVHLPGDLFKRGINNVSVTLNNHGHMYWLANDKKVLATLTITPDVENFIVHDFASFPVNPLKK